MDQYTSELKSLRDKVKIDIQALLCSSKDGLTDRELLIEYRNLIGKDIPYTELGFVNLNALMRSFDFVQIQRHRNGHSCVYHAIFDDSTKELGKLVQGQLDPKKSLREKKRNNEAFRYSQRISSYRTNNTSFYSRNGYSSSSQNNISSLSSNPNRVVPPEVQKKLEDLLKKCANYRLTLYELDLKYKEAYGSDLNPTKYGYNSQIELFESLNHLVYIEYNNSYKQANKSQINSSDIVIGLECSNSINSTDNSTPLSNMDQVMEDLKCLIESYGPEGICVRSLVKAYQDTYNKNLDLEKYGYKDLLMFIGDKLHDFVELVESDSGDYRVCKLERKEIKQTLVKSDLKKANKLSKELIQTIENAFKHHVDVKMSEEKFFALFEKRNGWKLDPVDYGFSNFHQLKAYLSEIGILNLEFDKDFNVLYSYPSEYVNNKKVSSEKYKTYKVPNGNSSVVEKPKVNETESLNIRERELFEWKKYQAEFIQDYVIYDTDMDKNYLHKRLLEQKVHTVLISNVENPCNFQIQLVDYLNDLNALMDELEKVYYGIGSSYYDMPEEYVRNGKLCVAIYDKDKNWHRCRIVGMYEKGKEKLVKVTFLDYGGFAWVKMNELKFLAKQFGSLPIQAINARFYAVRPRPSNMWHKDIINYLLNRVMNKHLEVHVKGIRQDFVSLEIFDKTIVDANGRPAGTAIHLNKRIVMDGYADLYDETSDHAFMDYDQWKLNYELSELDLQYSKKSNDSTRSLLSNSEDLKDQNNNNLNLSINNSYELNQTKYTNMSQTTKFKKIDTLLPNTVLKQRRVKLELNNRQIVLNIISIDKKIYIHSNEVADLVSVDPAFFEEYTVNSFYIKNLQNDTVYITKFLNNPENKELFDWIITTIDNLKTEDKITEAYLFVLENLNKFLDFYCPIISNYLNGLLNEALKPARKQPKPSEDKNSQSELLSDPNSRIQLIQKEMETIEKNCDNIRYRMANMSHQSEEYKQIAQELSAYLDQRKFLSKELKELKARC